MVRGEWFVEKAGDPQTTGHSPLTVPWLAALQQAWTAYVRGSYAIGAVIVDAGGQVIARGRNRLGEPRQAGGGMIGGHDLAHAEINALLNLTDTPKPAVYGWTVLTTVQPCPQCAGAIAMSGIRAVAYAAPDPWAGCTRLLTDDPYVSRKGIRVERAPDMVQRAALRLALLGFMREEGPSLDAFLSHFHEYAQDVTFARRLHGEGTLAALREREAPLEEALAALLGGPVDLEGESWPVEEASCVPFPNLSPSPDRTGRVCVWVEREGRVLMTGREWGGWTLPGGGICPGETGEEAAVRETWEECGVRVELTDEAVRLTEESLCYPARLLSLSPSPEGRVVAWVNPRALPWADDVQVRQVLAARGETPGSLALPERVQVALSEAERLGFGHSCRLETGRLLRTLAATRPGGQFAELGTGTGGGAAWLLAGMNAPARLVTVELDAERAEAARSVLAGDGRVTVLTGDWTQALASGPFDLMFSDCAPAKRGAASLERLVEALKPGGLLVLDDFSPPARLPQRLHAGDPEREALWGHPALTCSEVAVSAAERVILAVRKG